MKNLITLVLLISIILFIPSVSFAAESSPSADIRAKLEELKKEIASKAAKLKSEIDKKITDKAYVGKVTDNSDTTLSLATLTGARNIKLTQDTVFESTIKAKTKYSAKTIATDDYLVALGDIDEREVLIAKKIILLPAPASASKIALWGQIVSMTDDLITLKDKDLKSHAVSISDLKSIRLNDYVIFTGTLGKNDIFEAEFVYKIPQGMIPKPKISPSPSAKVASPSGKVSSASAKPTTKPAVKK